MFVLLMSFVSAAHNGYQGDGYLLTFGDDNNSIDNQNQIRVINRFQERAMFNCTGDCDFNIQSRDGVLKLYDVEKVTNAKFLCFNVKAKDRYVVGDDGQIISQSRNVWGWMVKNLFKNTEGVN